MAVTPSPAMSILEVPKVAKSGGASQSPARRRPGGPAARAHLPLNPPLTSQHGIPTNRKKVKKKSEHMQPTRRQDTLAETSPLTHGRPPSHICSVEWRRCGRERREPNQSQRSSRVRSVTADHTHKCSGAAIKAGVPKAESDRRCFRASCRPVHGRPGGAPRRRL